MIHLVHNFCKAQKLGHFGLLTINALKEMIFVLRKVGKISWSGGV
jgi:hypothetical protein